MTQASEAPQVPVFDAGRAEAADERRAFELRIAARAGYGADIDEPFNAAGFQHGDEPVDRQGRVSNGEDRAFWPVGLLRRRVAVHRYV
jgi:hypothetical protein